MNKRPESGGRQAALNDQNWVAIEVLSHATTSPNIRLCDRRQIPYRSLLTARRR
jgi:hypothetical protein